MFICHLSKQCLKRKIPCTAVEFSGIICLFVCSFVYVDLYLVLILYVLKIVYIMLLPPFFGANKKILCAHLG